MRKLLNTLYVATQGAYLSRKGETVRISVEREEKLRVPVHTLDGIVCFGQVTCSGPVLGLCAEHNVSVSFMSRTGRFLARVQGPISGNVLLRREQYRRVDSADAGHVAGAVVAAKIANSRTVLLRSARESGVADSKKELQSASKRLADLIGDLEAAEDLMTVRGIEGIAGRQYFDVFDHLIRQQKDEFRFTGRSRRPPLDNTNAMLSFAYTLLVHDVAGALETVGLDPQVGFLHRDRPGRPGLALDLMEELRPVLADRLVLSLINRRQITGDDFETSESGAVTMSEKSRKALIVTWQKRKEDVIEHPFLEEKIAIGLLPYAQALLMARYLRSDLDGYPPYLWR